MHIGIVCKVIDNYGDAGFSLRLAKGLARHQHRVTLCHDDPAAFHALYPEHTIPELKLIDATRADLHAICDDEFDLFLEPFGTSSEQTNNRFDVWLKENYTAVPWLVIDYLSAEQWVENFHFSNSIDPTNGHKTTFFYPGFTAATGGLIHSDYPAHLISNASSVDDCIRVFVFSYPNAPLNELLDTCNDLNAAGRNIEVGIAASKPQQDRFNWVEHLPFCPQAEFDELLVNFDVLFVRGEDSFIRAQLSGKPLIWQIYPTEDFAHAEKLLSFFKRYSKGLSEECAAALWNCWASWNGLEMPQNFSSSWLDVVGHLNELSSHAQAWRDQLLTGPELVREVLTWRRSQTPTLIEKPDL